MTIGPSGQDEPKDRARSSDGTELPALITPDGVPRLLAAFPTGEETQPKFMAAVGTTIPSNQWYEIDRHARVPILDQGSHGSCVGHGAVTSLMVARGVAAMPYEALSATYIYAHINHGQDAGSIPHDAVAFLRDSGTCLASQCGTNCIYVHQIPDQIVAAATALRFRLDLVYQIHSWEERVSAALMGFLFLDTVRVGPYFNNLNSEGVPPASAGVGNHAVCGGEGVKRLQDGRWAIKYRNSWGDQWGLNGFFYLTEQHFTNQPCNECFAFQAAREDVTDTGRKLPEDLQA